MTITIKPNEAYEKILTANLQRAIDFLKFAEAKNAALLALSSAWVMACINVVIKEPSISNGCFKSAITFTLLCAICAGILAMLSFLPRLNLPKFLGGRAMRSHPKNLLFFGDISTLSIKELEHDILEKYCPPTNEKIKQEYINDLIVQISVNSQITMRKMRLFRYGIIFILIAAIALFFPVLLLNFKNVRSIW